MSAAAYPSVRTLAFRMTRPPSLFPGPVRCTRALEQCNRMTKSARRMEVTRAVSNPFAAANLIDGLVQTMHLWTPQPASGFRNDSDRDHENAKASGQDDVKLEVAVSPGPPLLTVGS